MACYNFGIYDLILILFGRNVTQEVNIQRVGRFYETLVAIYEQQCATLAQTVLASRWLRGTLVERRSFGELSLSHA